MSQEGTLGIELGTRRGVVADVAISSTRRVDAVRVLLGRPVLDAMAGIPLLFSICAEAQSVAAVEACEAALGLSVDESQRAARELMVVAEAIDNHAWQVALKWPTVFGDEAAVVSMRDLRKATLEVRACIGFAARWRLPGGASLSPDADMAVQLEGAAVALASLAGLPLPHDLEGLQTWCHGSSIGQRTIARLLELGCDGFGRSEVGLLPPLPPRWFEAQLSADPHFEAHPTFEWQPAETGSLARRAEHPLLARVRRRYGNGLLARFVARLVDLESLLHRARTLVPAIQASPGASDPARLLGSGVGTAVVETARGALCHCVTLNAGRVTGWRVVAPTEWNFHPSGPLVEGLRGASTDELEARANLLIMGLDPCVAFELSLKELPFA